MGQPEKLARRPSGRDLVPEGGECSVLSPLDRHGADAQLRGGPAEAEPLQHRQPQRCRLGCWQLVDQVLQPRLQGFWGQLLGRGGEDIEPGVGAARQGLVEALMLPGGSSPGRGRQSDQQSPVPEVVLQRALNANLEVRGSGDWVGHPAAGLHELQTGHALGVAELQQIGEAAMKAVGNAIGEGNELVDKAITGGKRAHRGDGEGRTPHPAGTIGGKTKPAPRRPPTTDRSLRRR